MSPRSAEGNLCAELADPEELVRGSHQPVKEYRLVIAVFSVIGWGYPVTALDHLFRSLCKHSFVDIEERGRAKPQKRNKDDNRK